MAEGSKLRTLPHTRIEDVDELPTAIEALKPKVIITNARVTSGIGSAVYGTTNDGQGEVKLFSFFDDELTFLPGEFIGLTVKQALALFAYKDITYLQS